MNTFDIIAIGELNADLILNRIDGMPVVGKEIFAHDMLLALGSSTAIFAANAASLGAKTGFVGMIGRDDFGRLVRTSLDAKNVDTKYLIETDKCPTGATIVLSYGEDRANVTFQGTMDLMGFDDIDKSIFDKTRHIHISSIFMQSALKRDLAEILTFAKEKRVTVSLDTQWDPAEKWDLDLAEMLPLITVFMPNETELMLLTDKETLPEAVAAIKPHIGGVLVVKCGNKGSILVKNDGSENILGPFLNTDVIDATGAGDSFNAGFIYMFTRGASLEECQKFGNLTGAINTTATGGTGAFSSKASIEKIAVEKFGQKIKL
jgi:sugar/nucleoside kinase (ribokinase family)